MRLASDSHCPSLGFARISHAARVGPVRLTHGGGGACSSCGLVLVVLYERHMGSDKVFTSICLNEPHSPIPLITLKPLSVHTWVISVNSSMAWRSLPLRAPGVHVHISPTGALLAVGGVERDGPEGT